MTRWYPYDWTRVIPDDIFDSRVYLADRFTSHDCWNYTHTNLSFIRI